MNISIFGLGYVGCVSIGCLAKNGHKVIGVDVNQTKVDVINAGKSPIIEKDIEDIIFEQKKGDNIRATCDSQAAVLATDVSIICVGTPSTANGHLDLHGIYKVAEEIGKALKKKPGFHVIAIRSTVIPGTNAKVTDIIANISGRDRDGFAVVSNPEFLREGTAVIDYAEPPYTLIGASDQRAVDMMREIYGMVNAPFISTDIKVAELTKYVCNSFHALKITFANEIGSICRELGIDSHKLMEIFCRDTKLNISPYYLKPGFAYGGSCLPKDLKALSTIAHDHYLSCPVLENIERSNETQKDAALNRILSFGKRKIGFLGLSFKAGTDDLRSSPVIDLLEKLLGKGFEVLIYDKNVRMAQLLGANKEFIMSKIPFISSFIVEEPSNLIKTSEVVVIVNNEKEFSGILEKLDRSTIVFDLVNFPFGARESFPSYQGVAW